MENPSEINSKRPGSTLEDPAVKKQKLDEPAEPGKTGVEGGEIVVVADPNMILVEEDTDSEGSVPFDELDELDETSSEISVHEPPKRVKEVLRAPVVKLPKGWGTLLLDPKYTDRVEVGNNERPVSFVLTNENDTAPSRFENVLYPSELAMMSELVYQATWLGKEDDLVEGLDIYDPAVDDDKHRDAMSITFDEDELNASIWDELSRWPTPPSTPEPCASTTTTSSSSSSAAHHYVEETIPITGCFIEKKLNMTPDGPTPVLTLSNINPTSFALLIRWNEYRRRSTTGILPALPILNPLSHPKDVIRGEMAKLLRAYIFIGIRFMQFDFCNWIMTALLSLLQGFKGTKIAPFDPQLLQEIWDFSKQEFGVTDGHSALSVFGPQALDPHGLKGFGDDEESNIHGSRSRALDLLDAAEQQRNQISNPCLYVRLFVCHAFNLAYGENGPDEGLWKQISDGTHAMRLEMEVLMDGAVTVRGDGEVLMLPKILDNRMVRVAKKVSGKWGDDEWDSEDAEGETESEAGDEDEGMENVESEREDEDGDDNGLLEAIEEDDEHESEDENADENPAEHEIIEVSSDSSSSSEEDL